MKKLIILASGLFAFAVTGENKMPQSMLLQTLNATKTFLKYNKVANQEQKECRPAQIHKIEERLFNIGQEIEKNRKISPISPDFKPKTTIAPVDQFELYKAEIKQNHTNFVSGIKKIETDFKQMPNLTAQPELHGSFIFVSKPKRTIDEAKSSSLYKEFIQKNNPYNGGAADRQGMKHGIDDTAKAIQTRDDIDKLIINKLVDNQDEQVKELLTRYEAETDQYFSSWRTVARKYGVKSAYNKEDRNLLSYPMLRFDFGLKKQFQDHTKSLVHLMNEKPNQKLNASALNHKDAAFEAIEEQFNNEIPNYIEKEKLILFATQFPPTTDKTEFIKQYTDEVNQQLSMSPSTLQNKLEAIKDLNYKLEKIEVFTPAYADMIAYVRTKYALNNPSIDDFSVQPTEKKSWAAQAMSGFKRLFGNK